MTVYTIAVTPGTPEGTPLTSANTGFTVVLGNATFVASAADPADGTIGGLLTFPSASQTKQLATVFDEPTPQFTAVFKRKREGGVAKTATAHLFRAYIGGTASPYAGGTHVINAWENPNGTIRVDAESPGRTLFTSATTAPLPVGHLRFSIRGTIGGSAGAGTLSMDVYAGNDATPLPGLSFTSTGLAFGTAGFTSVQLGRPGSSTDQGAERWLPARIKTGADAAAKDTAPTGVSAAPVAVVGVPYSRTAVSFAGSTGTLSNVTTTPAQPGLAVDGLVVSFLEQNRTVPVVVTGVLTNAGGQTPVHADIPVVTAGAPKVIRVGELIRVDEDGPWL